MTEKRESLFASFIDPPVRGDNFTTDHGGLHSFDGAAATTFTESDVAEVLYHGHSGEDWDGTEAAVIRLNDGRIVAWESVWGPTGSGFCEDAYGGDAEVWFAKPESLNRLVLQALTDQGRRLCGIPAEGFPE
jgi:hypothetical protein